MITCELRDPRFGFCCVCGHRGAKGFVAILVDIRDGVEHYRCHKHKDRNPCAIEGCERSRAAKGRFADNAHLCVEHWHMFAPPRSKIRRAYHAHWRRAKKLGWSPKRVRAFERLWDTIVARARRQSVEGRLEMTEINAMFGWGE